LFYLRIIEFTPGEADMTTPDFADLRADFPRTRTAAYFDNASSHPLSVHSTAALHRYVEWLSHDVGEPWWPTWAGARDDSKLLFARLINAEPGEIAHARSTVEAESNLLNGMAHHLHGGNIVTCDLSFSANLYNYKMRERDGLDVRIVPHQDWQIDMAAMDEAIDDDTRLVSIALVSNVNGYLADIGALSNLAHARGAYLYADIMQAVGAVPIDVHASGIDMAACSTFKWLMGVKGFGYVYVRADLQGTIVNPTQHAGGVSFNYEPWTDTPDTTRPRVTFQPTEGPSQYEVSYPSYEGAICAQESLRYIERLGVENIRAHARELTDRLQEELPRLGYRSITPRNNDSPILSFLSPDPSDTVARCRQAGVHVAMRFGNKLRLSPSVYNNQQDVDRLLQALA
jgi:selenocysteine lyase/cysteine desulfurase